MTEGWSCSDPAIPLVTGQPKFPSFSTRLQPSQSPTLPPVRAHRVRVVPPKKLRSTKSRYGEEVLLRSKAGWALKLDRIAEQFRKQDGVCACGHMLSAATARFRSPKFVKGEENPLICPDCQKFSEPSS